MRRLSCRSSPCPAVRSRSCRTIRCPTSPDLPDPAEPLRPHDALPCLPRPSVLPLLARSRQERQTMPRGTLPILPRPAHDRRAQDCRAVPPSPPLAIPAVPDRTLPTSAERSKPLLPFEAPPMQAVTSWPMLPCLFMPRPNRRATPYQPDRSTARQSCRTEIDQAQPCQRMRTAPGQSCLSLSHPAIEAIPCRASPRLPAPGTSSRPPPAFLPYQAPPSAVMPFQTLPWQAMTASAAPTSNPRDPRATCRTASLPSAAAARRRRR